MLFRSHINSRIKFLDEPKTKGMNLPWLEDVDLPVVHMNLACIHKSINQPSETVAVNLIQFIYFYEGTGERS